MSTTRRRPENMHEVGPRPIHVIWLYLTRCNQGIANAGAVESLLARRAQPDRAFDSKQWIWLQSFATVAAGADQRSNIFRPRPKPRVRIVIILVECVLHGCAAWPLSCVPVCAILITQEDLLEIATYQPVNHARCVYLRPPFSFLCFFEGVGPAPRDF